MHALKNNIFQGDLENEENIPACLTLIFQLCLHTWPWWLAGLQGPTCIVRPPPYYTLCVLRSLWDFCWWIIPSSVCLPLRACWSSAVSFVRKPCSPATPLTSLITGHQNPTELWEIIGLSHALFSLKGTKL